MDIEVQKRLIKYLFEQVSHDRKQKIKQVVWQRTRYISIILEDINQAHNASAVIRSAECFGIQDVHIIEKKHIFAATDGVALGASKWINMQRYKKTEICFDILKKRGYRIIATTLHKGAGRLDDFSIDRKFALIFGTEHAGLSEYALDHADELVTIPMFGFTQSFNVSVSAALFLHYLVNKLHVSSINWQLLEEERLDIMLEWLRKSIRGACEFERMFFYGSGE